MTVCILKDGSETHQVFNVKCSTKKEMQELPGFGSIHTATRTTCTMESDTRPAPYQEYDMKCKDDACSCNRFQIIRVSANPKPKGRNWIIEGECLADLIED